MQKIDFNSTENDWEIGDEYEITKIIGKGSYGDVAEAIQKRTGKRVAIKRIYHLFDDLVDCKRIVREICILRRIKHPNVVGLLDIIEPKDLEGFDTLYLVTEFCQSDIKKMVKSSTNLIMDHIQLLMYNLLCGLKYVHSADVIHRDIKPANILINEDCSLKICDFGLARSIHGVETSFSSIIPPYLAKSEDKAEVVVVKSPPPAKKEDQVKKEIHKQLIKTKDARKNMKRELTGHVVTRWYRAPELILLEKDYGPAIDIWSSGCIFAELLSMIKENAPTYLDRKPLFPGSSCFPLSPDAKAEKKKGFPHSSADQLNVIFDVIGTPNEEDMSFVTDTKAIDYLKSFAPRERMNIKELYPASGKNALDLLNRMLVFNPYFRLSLNDCLSHPYFEGLRENSKEMTATEPITLDFEKGVDLDAGKLRELFINEIKYFKNLRMLHKKK